MAPRAWTPLLAAAVLLGAVVFAFPTGAQAHALTAQQATYLALAQQGAARAKAAFADDHHGIWNGKRNVPLRWYDERLHSGLKYPLATIWGAVPLFESLAAIASANPTAANRGALTTFAEGPHPPSALPGSKLPKGEVLGGAESYWDPAVGGFAPYPGDRGDVNTWFDDNSWWGIAFTDAYQVLRLQRLLRDAQTAFDFVVRRGWDASSGGLWWNTDHTPAGQKSGEALAAGSLLGALLARDWQEVANSASGQAKSEALALASSDRASVEKFINWGDAHFADLGGLYARTQSDPTPMPYVAGPEIEAKQLLCLQLEPGNPYCAQARALADVAYRRFGYRLNMGPQFDVIYLHWMLVYAHQTADPRWAPMAQTFAQEARVNSLDPSSGLYLKAWDGSNMSAHQAEPNMLRTDAATVELFSWVAAVA